VKLPIFSQGWRIPHIDIEHLSGSCIIKHRICQKIKTTIKKLKQWHSICSAKIEIISLMKRNYLGEFEELVLLSVAVLDGKAYGVALLQEINVQTERSVHLNQVHAALQRLEDKGMVASAMGEPTAERGGRRKRFFQITPYGLRTLEDIQNIRNSFWSRLGYPKIDPSL
jgi:DNA-binding PadR family transcriptional regulator